LLFLVSVVIFILARSQEALILKGHSDNAVGDHIWDALRLAIYQKKKGSILACRQVSSPKKQEANSRR